MKNKLVLIEGPNLNLVHQRSQLHYGDISSNDIQKMCKEKCKEFSLNFDYFQSNSEGELINIIQGLIDSPPLGIICNFGGLSHSSISIHDALLMVICPKIEVHLSYLIKREEMRLKLITAKACNGMISGLGSFGYLLAIEALEKFKSQKEGNSKCMIPTNFEKV